MDKTEQFIKMCDCPEIQEQEFDNRPNFHLAYFLRGQWKIEWDFLGGEKLPIWLPRQDQIQEMLIKEKFGDFGAHWDICIDIPIQFVAKNPDLELSSMEQIWLSCYMLSIHQKLWSSKEEKWVKKKKYTGYKIQKKVKNTKLQPTIDA